MKNHAIMGKNDKILVVFLLNIDVFCNFASALTVAFTSW